MLIATATITIKAVVASIAKQTASDLRSKYFKAQSQKPLDCHVGFAS
jgi:hypothetical protein